MKKRIIYIPYHQKVDELCDFVFQTVRELLKRGYEVNLILYQYAYLFGLAYKRCDFSNTYIELLKNPRFKIIRPLMSIPPRKGFHRIHALHRQLFIKYLAWNIIQFKHNLLWVFWPEDTNLIESVKRIHSDTVCIYDCVDYFSSRNSDLNMVIREQELSLIKKSDFVFVNSRALYNQKKAFRLDIRLVPLGFDKENFERAKRLHSPEIEEIFKNIPSPIVGYCGYLSYRVNFSLLETLAMAMPDISFVFIGPIKFFPYELSEEKTITHINRLKSFPNVFFIQPARNRSEVAKLIRCFDICTIPYNVSIKFNKYCYPTKLFEYFYSGKPVLSTPIEELKRFPKYVRLGRTAQEWEDQIVFLLSKPWSGQTQQRKLASKNSWEGKVSIILRFIDKPRI